MIKTQRFPLFLIPFAILSSAAMCDTGFSVSEPVEVTLTVDSEESSFEASETKSPCANERVRENKDKIKAFNVNSVTCEIIEVRAENTATEVSGTATVAGVSTTLSNVPVALGTVPCPFDADQINTIAAAIKSACESDSEVTVSASGTSEPAGGEIHVTLKATVDGEFEVSL